MGNILPASITHPQVTGPNALPNRALFNNGNVNYGAVIGDIGDILRGLGGPAGSWDPILRQREAEDAAQQQRAIESQRYAAATRQQQFSNNLALQNYQLRTAALMNRGQGDPDHPASFIGTGPLDSDVPTSTSRPNNLGDPAASNIGPTISSLAQLQGTSGPRISALQTKNASNPSTFDANAANNIAMASPMQIAPSNDTPSSGFVHNLLTAGSGAVHNLLTAISPVATASAAPIARQNVNMAEANGVNNDRVPYNVTNQDIQKITSAPILAALNNGTSNASNGTSNASNASRIGEPNSIPEKQVISPDTLQGTARDIYDKFDLHQPQLARDLIAVANHQIPLTDILKNWKTSADRTAITRSLYVINPNYDERVAQRVQQFRKTLENPKAPENIGLRSDQELANLIQEQEANIKNLPDWRYPFLTGLRDIVGRWTGNQALSRFDQLADPINKEIERGRLQGRPTVSSLSTLAPLYSASLGHNVLRRSYDDLLRDIDRRTYGQIYNAVASTNGYGGFRSSDLNPTVVKRLHDKGYINVTSDGVIRPLVNPDRLSIS